MLRKNLFNEWDKDLLASLSPNAGSQSRLWGSKTGERLERLGCVEQIPGSPDYNPKYKIKFLGVWYLFLLENNHLDTEFSIVNV